ncbi:MAG: HXXEE domain-containing protein [Spirulinaceae cyanobacterium]
MSAESTQNVAPFYWLVGMVQVAHSIEETVTELYSKFGPMSAWLHHIFPIIPHFTISADLFAVLNYVMLALLLGTVPAAATGSRLGSIFMWSWAIIELLNGLFHISTWIVLRSYFPGGITGPILFILAIVFMQNLLATDSSAAPAEA